MGHVVDEHKEWVRSLAAPKAALAALVRKYGYANVISALSMVASGQLLTLHHERSRSKQSSMVESYLEFLERGLVRLGNEALDREDGLHDKA